MNNSILPCESIINLSFKERGIKDVIKWDIFAIRDGQIVKLIFESSVSEWRQGVWMKTDKGLLVNNCLCSSVELWMDNTPNEILLKCNTSDTNFHVYNIWDRGKGRESQAWTSGMRVEILPNGRRYFCNDIGFDTDFKKLIFRLEIV